MSEREAFPVPSLDLNNLLHCLFQVDPSGPLATLHKILLSEESIAVLRNFLESHWYTVVIVAGAVFCLMVIAINLDPHCD